MNLHEYRASAEICLLNPPFYALIMAAMRGADTRNAEKLRVAFPDTWVELQARYNAPGGLLPGEPPDNRAGGIIETSSPSYPRLPVDDTAVLGCCPHGVNLDRDFCEKGCRV